MWDQAGKRTVGFPLACYAGLPVPGFERGTAADKQRESFRKPQP